jgi:site-specific DNA-methyltransferase (adenine-specific)
VAKRKPARPQFDVQQADCVKYLDSLKRKPNLLICDPPYNYGQGYEYGTDNLVFDEYREWTHSWLLAAKAALDKHGAMWVFIPDEWVSEIDLYCRKDLGMTRRSWVIWYYTFGVANQKNFSRSHTHLLYFTKAKTVFTFNDEGIRVASARQAVYNDKRQRTGGKLPDNTWVLLREQLQPLFEPNRDTWLESRICGTFKERKKHSPNQLPEPIVERIILSCSNPGDLVVDPFLGSGTTGAVAVRLGRDFAGCDLSKTCVMESIDRIGRSLLV